MVQQSVWEKESFFAPADIIIAGSGLVGLWSAYYLKKLAPSLSITIIERGLIPSGASTRNAGFACFGSLSELVTDARNLGMDQLLELVDMRYRGIKKIKKIFGSEAIGYEKHGGYELIGSGSPAPKNTPAANSATRTHPTPQATPEADSTTDATPPDSQAAEQGSAAPDLSDLDQLRSSIDEFNRLLKKITGQQKTFRLQNEKIGEFGFANVQYLIENQSEGQLHSGKLCQALIRLVQSMGVNILNNTGITGYEKVHGHLLLHTQYGFPLIAQQMLVTTNAFALQLLPQLDITPARGQVLVTSPIEGLPFKGSFHFDEGFYYFRDLGDRVLLGGARNMAFEEETTTEMATTERIQNELERFLGEVILPGRFHTIEHRWSGIMAMGSEKMPIIKAVNEHVFCAVRMSGMGVALAPIVGEKVATLMTSGGEPG
ncbi:MAG: FAD-binding oxidoreductase [Bacteroidetes bacterium]|nr:FAD-binding oxidoreductase [Bacteroidota bacterium]